MGDLVLRRYEVKNPELSKRENFPSHFWKARVKKVTGTTNATAATETAHAHGLPFTPLNAQILIQNSDKEGAIYFSKAADGTSFYTKCDVVSVSFVAWIFYET